MDSAQLMEIEEPLWFCVQTQPKHEKIAARFLRSQVGLEVFSPVIRFQRATASGRKWFEEALFPGYIFGRFPYRTHYRLVAASLGVTKIVGFGGQPAVVDPGVLEDLRQFAKDNEVIEVAPQIAPGEEVTVLDGPFKGLRALVTKVMPAKDRIAVLLELLGTQREVEVTASRVLPGKVHPLSGRG